MKLKLLNEKLNKHFFLANKGTYF